MTILGGDQVGRFEFAEVEEAELVEVEIELVEAEAGRIEIVELEVEAGESEFAEVWEESPEVDASQHWLWRCRIGRCSVGGGKAEWVGQRDQEQRVMFAKSACSSVSVIHCQLQPHSISPQPYS